ncbi:MAG: alpha/beta fold hydrolase [Gemmatimonadales bacterium]
MTTLPTVELAVYPYECDAFGHLNQASFLTVFERARWEALARGPGMDIFRRHGVWPTVRRATVDYRAAVYPGDVVRIETQVLARGTTSLTLRHIATRSADETLVAEAEIVFVMIDRVGRPVPMSDELAQLFGPRTSGGGATAREPQRVAVPGAELAVEVRGEGLPVLLVHGFPLDRTMWRHQIAGLSRCRRIAPDLRGAGASSVPPDGYAVARYADDLVAVLDALGVRQAVACGLSMGGYIVFELVRRHADRLKAIVLADTKAEADSPEARRGRDELAAVAARDGAGAVADRLLPRLLSPATHAAQPEVARQVREMIERQPVAGIVGALAALRDRPDSRATLGAVRVPTLVLVGGDDAITPPAAATAMAAAISGAQYVTIPAAGHLAPLEQPLAVARALGDFVGSLG